MKKLSTFLKTLLVAVGIGVGSSAWATDTPNGYGVSNVFLGTSGSANANGIVTTVAIEDFEGLTSLSSAWGTGTLTTNQSINLIDIVTSVH